MGKLSFGSTGLSYQVDKVDLKVGGAPQCPRCAKSVYFNEEKKAHGRSWHTQCFTCAECSKHLDSTNAASHEEEIYCSACHRRQFGPKGYGFAGGASGLSTESTIHHVRPVGQTQTHAVPELVPAKKVDRADPSCCPRCGKRVYFAEEVKAMRRSWHRLCFKCGTCNKMLEPGRCSEHEGELYCQACYGRQFGPKGYGFAGGAGQTLSSDSHPYFPHKGRSSVEDSSSSSTGQSPARKQQQQQQQQQACSSGTPSPASSSNSSMHSPSSNSMVFPASSNSMVFPASSNSMVFPASTSAKSYPPQPVEAAASEPGSHYMQNGSSTRYYAAPVHATSATDVDRYAQEQEEEETAYSRAQPAPAGGAPAGAPAGEEEAAAANTHYYGTKEWKEPVFL